MAEYSYLMKICLFADKDAGKKTLVKSNILHNYYKVEDYLSTIGVEFCTKTVDYREGIRIHLWIISEKEYHARSWKLYIHGSLGVILMYDITNAKTLNRLSEWCQMVRKYREEVPILLVGNKLDLEENREVSKEQVEMLKQDNNLVSSMEISVKTGENVEKMFLKILSMILNIELKELKAGILEEQEQKLEKIREDFIWRIDRAIKISKKKLQGKRNLKKLKSLWSKTFFGKTTFFEEYIVKQRLRAVNLAENKNELINAKNLTEVMNAWYKIKGLLFTINF